jgi:hypothetical protein
MDSEKSYLQGRFDAILLIDFSLVNLKNYWENKGHQWHSMELLASDNLSLTVYRLIVQLEGVRQA